MSTIQADLFGTLFPTLLIEYHLKEKYARENYTILHFKEGGGYNERAEGEDGKDDEGKYAHCDGSPGRRPSRLLPYAEFSMVKVSQIFCIRGPGASVVCKSSERVNSIITSSFSRYYRLIVCRQRS